MHSGGPVPTDHPPACHCPSGNIGRAVLCSAIPPGASRESREKRDSKKAKNDKKEGGRRDGREGHESVRCNRRRSEEMCGDG